MHERIEKEYMNKKNILGPYVYKDKDLSKKELILYTLSALIQVLIVYLLLQIFNAFLGIDGTNFDNSFISTLMFRIVFAIGVLFLFSIWIFLITRIFTKKISFLEILQIVTFANFSTFLYLILGYIPFLKQFPFLSLILFIFLVFIRLNKKIGRKSILVIFIGFFLIPVSLGLFFGIGKIIVRSLIYLL